MLLRNGQATPHTWQRYVSSCTLSPLTPSDVVLLSSFDTFLELKLESERLKQRLLVSHYLEAP